jgi:hypothetical protein
MHLESIRELFCERFEREELVVLASLLARLPGGQGSDVEGDFFAVE